MTRKGFHAIFTRGIVIYLLLGLLLSNGLFYYIFSRPLGRSYPDALATLYYIDTHAAAYALKVTGYVLLLVIPLIFLASVLMSHRISGPAYRLQKSAESFADGDLSVWVRVRDKDQMQDIASEMEETLKALSARLSEAGDAASVVEKLLSRPVEDAKTVEALKAGNARLERELSFFKK